MEGKCLDSATLATGINPDYINTRDKPQSINVKTRRHLFDAMHQRTATKMTVTSVPNVMVYTSGKKVPMVVEGNGEYSRLPTIEEGTQHKDHVVGGRVFNLPMKLLEDYHTLTPIQGDQRAHYRVIVVPKCCYEPQALLNKQKLWGACVQLYTLRSEKNWGIGDSGDLKAMLEDVAKHDGLLIGLNPIHTLCPANPESVSLYSPSSRHWLNVIYIGVNAVEDLRLNEEAQAWWQLPTTQQTLQQVWDADWIDYSTITTPEITALRMAWKGFARRDDRQMTTFRQFVAEQDNSPFWQAVSDVLYAQQVKKNETRWG